MMKFRVSVLLCLALGLPVAAYGQFAAQYTEQPPTNVERREMIAEADWYVAAFKDPEKAFKEDQPNVAKYLGISAYEIPRLTVQGPMSLRTLLAKKLLTRAQYDPLFDGLLRIAATEFEDRVTAIQATQLLVDALQMYSARYPNTIAASKPILLKRLQNPLFGAKYAAIIGLGYASNSAPAADVLDALIAELKSEEELIVDAAATSLGNLGDRRAVGALMARFIELPEIATSEEPDEGTSGGTKPSAEPLNQARLSIALAVQRLAGLNIITPEMLKVGERNEMVRAYEILLNWWEDNKGGFE